MTATEMAHALGLLDWGAEGIEAEEDDYLFALSGELRAPAYRPSIRGLMSPRPASLWVLDEDPLVTCPSVQAALGVLAASYRIRRLGTADRGFALEELRAGRRQLPWVVIYGESERYLG